MSHFAKLDENNVVIFVTVGRDEDDENELTARTGDVYKRTSYNTYGNQHALGDIPFRKNYAGLGYIYDAQRDAFIAPQPHPSWTLNEDTCLWQAPVVMPDTGVWAWDENTLSWI
jgi:hypothetical protein